ncbi:methyltransferase domain-containing protein [Streptomyces sp. SBT349]|uniref:methyltransferase domain-containing protein n=1 Tax=Streptomyces sp. SBT349 TaxID=1580539 RepID=UPI00066B3D30|nr:methyltransferase domain-containing protein [Streptomyces sp. SBT349]
MRSDVRHLADALVRVGRHRFIPPQAWAQPPGAHGYWIDREARPHEWWEAVHSETVIYTQLDDGRTELTAENAARTYAPTCSASNPVVVSAFLRLLAVRPGDRVLEIGTGTGWTAALLCYLAGDAPEVTSVEIDAALAATAEAGLRTAGTAPRVVVGDGEDGHPPGAPFDRVHVTCGVRDIPYAWVAQTRPGGVIVLPYAPAMLLLRLVVGEDGTAIGQFHDSCSFMPLRGQRPSRPATAETPPRVRELTGDAEALLDPEPGLQFFFDVFLGDTPWATGPGNALVSDGVSKAVVAGNRVTQTGPRDLWDEAEHLHREWNRSGRPGLERVGVTVTRECQYVWLDDPTAPAADILDHREKR